MIETGIRQGDRVRIHQPGGEVSRRELHGRTGTVESVVHADEAPPAFSVRLDGHLAAFYPPFGRSELLVIREPGRVG